MKQHPYHKDCEVDFKLIKIPSSGCPLCRIQGKAWNINTELVVLVIKKKTGPIMICFYAEGTASPLISLEIYLTGRTYQWIKQFHYRQ